MRDMAHSICLIKLYQITMRKNFDFLFLTTLIALMCARMLLRPDNSKGQLNIRLSRLHFVVALNQWQTLYSHLRLTLGRDPFKFIRL